VNIKLLLTFHT